MAWHGMAWILRYHTPPVELEWTDGVIHPQTEIIAMTTGRQAGKKKRKEGKFELSPQAVYSSWYCRP